MRTFCLLLSMVSFAIALCYARRWDLLGIDPLHEPMKDMNTWFAVGGIALAASWLPWGTRLRYWMGTR